MGRSAAALCEMLLTRDRRVERRADLCARRKHLKDAGGNPTPYQVDLLRYCQYLHINGIQSRPLMESCQAKILEDFKWEDWADRAKSVANPHKRGDIWALGAKERIEEPRRFFSIHF